MCVWEERLLKAPLPENFQYQHNQLWIESVSAEAIIQQVGTPTYVYSQATLLHNWQIIQQAFTQSLARPPMIAYAVKANSHLAILSLLAKQGASFDVVSSGELKRALKAGADPEKIFFSGVGKTTAELQEAIDVSIGGIHVESTAELYRLNALAGQSGKIIDVALRVNPDVNPDTHPYIATGLKENKFGIAIAEAKQLYQQRSQYPNVCFTGIACHIGSQILKQEPYLEALQALLDVYDELAQEGLMLKKIDLGGGFGITYTQESPLNIENLAQAVGNMIGDRPITLMLEPGRSIVGNAGILLTRVEYIKTSQKNPSCASLYKGGEAVHQDKCFAIIDAGMNDLLRPALYQASHPIWPIMQLPNQPSSLYDIVGPICETSDFFAKAYPLSASLKSGDALAIGMAGAYGASMSSHYNTRSKPAEVLVNGTKMCVIRPRESFEDLVQLEIW